MTASQDSVLRRSLQETVVVPVARSIGVIVAVAADLRGALAFMEGPIHQAAFATMHKAELSG